jgi:hypothetical protein
VLIQTIPDLTQAHISGDNLASDPTGLIGNLSVSTAAPWVTVEDGKLKFTEAGIFNLSVEVTVSGIDADAQVRPGEAQFDFSGAGDLLAKPSYIIRPNYVQFTMRAELTVVVTDTPSGSFEAATVGEALPLYVNWSEPVTPAAVGSPIEADIDIYILRLA